MKNYFFDFFQTLILWRFSMYVDSRTRSSSDCLLENKFLAKSYHSCRNTATSFLLRGIRLRRSGCYRSSQNNVLSGDSSVRRGGKKLPFGGEGDEGEYTGSTEVFSGWSKTLAAGCIVPMQNVGVTFLFNPILLPRINNFYENSRRRHFGWVDDNRGIATNALKNSVEKDARRNNIKH